MKKQKKMGINNSNLMGDVNNPGENKENGHYTKKMSLRRLEECKF